MAEWTSDANEFLEGYLRQVAALARSQGDDGDDIAAGLREHITNEAEADATSLVTVEQIRKIIASVGTPEQVVSPDFTLAKPERRKEELRAATPPPARPQETPIIVNAPPAKTRSGCWLGLASIVVLIVALPIILAILGILSAILLPAVSRSREAARRATCQGNLKQAISVCMNYADEHNGLFPELSPSAGTFAMDPAEVADTFVIEPSFLACPSDETPPNSSGTIAERITDESYFYLGYVITNEEEAREFLDAYRNQASQVADFKEDLPAAPGEGTSGSGRFVRMQLHPSLALAGEIGQPNAGLPAPAEIPVMFDRAANHIPGGINVLYLDGHVEFLKMEYRWPAQQWFLDELAELSKGE